MDIFKEKVFLYLDKKTFGTLLIDDVSGVGKTYNVKKMITTNSGEFITSKVKYYCYLDVNHIKDINLKTYVIENSKQIHTNENADLYYNLSSLNKGKGYLNNSYLFYKIYIEKKIKILKKLLYPVKIILNIIASILAKTNININNMFDGLSTWKDMLYEDFNIDDSIVLVIDDLEKRNNNINLKDIFSSLLKFQENNDAKIILIINSTMISTDELSILNDWKKRSTQFTLNFNYDYNDYTRDDNFMYIAKSLKSFSSLSTLINEIFMDNIIEKEILLTNVVILQKIDKFTHELISIETELLHIYDEQIKNKNVDNFIKEEFQDLRNSLVIMSFMYLEDMDLTEEKEEYESYGDYETVDKYFKADHNNLRDRLELVISYYTDNVNYQEQFYLYYINANPEVKHKIISNKPVIYTFAFSKKQSIYELFSDVKYYPSHIMLDFYDQMVSSNYSKIKINEENFKLLNIIERIYEVKNIELIFEWNQILRITEDSYYLEEIISRLNYEFSEYKKFVRALNMLRSDIFVKELRNKVSAMFMLFKDAINSRFFTHLSIYDSLNVFDYMTKLEDTAIVLNLVDSCIYHNVDLSQGLKKFIIRNPKYMHKDMERIKRIGYDSQEIEEVQTNILNNIHIEDLDDIDYKLIKEEKKDRRTLINIFGNLVRYSINDQSDEG
jgi:hypothetical protein